MYGSPGTPNTEQAVRAFWYMGGLLSSIGKSAPCLIQRYTGLSVMIHIFSSIQMFFRFTAAMVLFLPAKELFVRQQGW